jgi:hypothetical protein
MRASQVADAAAWTPFARWEPTALSVVGRAVAARNPVLAGDAEFTVVIAWEGDAPWVEQQVARTHAQIGPARQRVSDASAEKLLTMLTEFEELEGPRLAFTTAHNTPAALATLAGTPEAERLVFHAPAGRLHLFPAADDVAAIAARLDGAGFACIDARGVTPRAPAAPQPAIAALRGRIRAALDPAGTLALGPRWLAT